MAKPIVGSWGIGGIDYYSSKPFVDLMKSADKRWNNSDTPPAYAGADGWLYACPNGSFDYTNLHAEGVASPYLIKLRTGTYNIVWQNPNLTITINPSAGVTRIGSVAPPVGWAMAYAFSIDSIVADMAITMIVQNLSGATLPNVKNVISCYHTDDEADFLVNNIFQSHWLNAHRGASIVRPVWMHPNGMGYPTAQGGTGDLGETIEFSDFNVETDRTWGLCPWSVTAKLATALDADLHVTIHPKMSLDCLTQVVSAINAYHSGVVYVESGNEWWNGGVPFNLNRNWASGTYAAGISVVDANGNPSTDGTDKIACSMADLASIAWAAFESVMGRKRVRRLLAGQHANWQALTPSALQYTVAKEPALSLYGAVKINTLVDIGATAPYMKISQSGTPIETKALCEAKAGTVWSNATWTANFKDYIDSQLLVWRAGWINGTTGFLSKAPQAKVSTYEGGIEFIAAYEVPGQMYALTVNSANNTMDSAIDITASFDNGDQIRLAYTVDTLASTTGPSVQNRPTWYVKKQGLDKLELYTDVGLTVRATITAANANSYNFDNWTRLYAIDQYVKAYFEGQLGADLYAYYYQQLFADGNMLALNQFTCVAPARPGYHYGMRADPFDDTNRAAWFRTKFSAAGGGPLRYNRYFYGTNRGDLA